MKKKFLIAIALVLLFALAGCGSKQTPTEPTVPPATEPVTESTESPDTNLMTEPTEIIPETKLESGFTFTTTNLAGETVTEAIFEGYDLVIINLWEPWCGPCVGEMPDMEKINQEYGDRVLILGVFSTEDGVEEVLAETGVTYPIVRDCPDFEPFYTPYVPTTVVLDGQGNQLTEPEPSAMPYEGWRELVEGLLP